MKSEIQKAIVVSLALLLLTGGSTLIQAQKPAVSKSDKTPRRADLGRTHSFENGEELLYVAEFSRALLRKMDVADFRFKATREKATESGPHLNNGGPAYSLKFTGDVSSKGFFTRLF